MIFYNSLFHCSTDKAAAVANKNNSTKVNLTAKANNTNLNNHNLPNNLSKTDNSKHDNSIEKSSFDFTKAAKQYILDYSKLYFRAKGSLTTQKTDKRTISDFSIVFNNTDNDRYYQLKLEYILYQNYFKYKIFAHLFNKMITLQVFSKSKLDLYPDDKMFFLFSEYSNQNTRQNCVFGKEDGTHSFAGIQYNHKAFNIACLLSNKLIAVLRINARIKQFFIIFDQGINTNPISFTLSRFAVMFSNVIVLSIIHNYKSKDLHHNTETTDMTDSIASTYITLQADILGTLYTFLKKNIFLELRKICKPILILQKIHDIYLIGMSFFVGPFIFKVFYDATNKSFIYVISVDYREQVKLDSILTN
jgi:hypothetical protein